MSSSAMPLATRLPTKGGGKSGLSDAMSARAGWPSTGVVSWGSSLLRLGTFLRRDLTAEERVVFPGLLEFHQAVHRAQPLEGIAAVEQAPLVDLAQVTLDVGPRQGGAPQEDGEVGQVALVELDQVLAHDQRGLHQEPAHPDGVGVVLLGGGDHLVDADLYAEVDDLVAVVGQDDVDQVLPDVVHIALDGGQHHGALAALIGLLHEGLEEGDRGLHRLGGLQYEGKLHLTARRTAHRRPSCLRAARR